MEKAAPLVSDLMKILSNRHRLLILCQLVEGEKSVGELAHALDLRQAALSQQLALLRKGGWCARAARHRASTTRSPATTCAG